MVYDRQAAGTANTVSDVDLFVVWALDDMALHKAVIQTKATLARTFPIEKRPAFLSKETGRSV